MAAVNQPYSLQVHNYTDQNKIEVHFAFWTLRVILGQNIDIAILTNHFNQVLSSHQQMLGIGRCC